MVVLEQGLENEVFSSLIDVLKFSFRMKYIDLF